MDLASCIPTTHVFSGVCTALRHCNDHLNSHDSHTLFANKKPGRDTWFRYLQRGKSKVKVILCKGNKLCYSVSPFIVYSHSSKKLSSAPQQANLKTLCYCSQTGMCCIVPRQHPQVLGKCGPQSGGGRLHSGPSICYGFEQVHSRLNPNLTLNYMQWSCIAALTFTVGLYVGTWQHAVLDHYNLQLVYRIINSGMCMEVDAYQLVTCILHWLAVLASLFPPVLTFPSGVLLWWRTLGWSRWRSWTAWSRPYPMTTMSPSWAWVQQELFTVCSFSAHQLSSRYNFSCLFCSSNSTH